MTLERPLLSVRLSVAYPHKPDVLKGLSLDVQKGEIVGLVGESGSGKSTLAMAILRLLDRKRARVTGEVLLDGVDLLKQSEKQLREIRGRKISVVLQSPLTSLNPALKIGTQLREAWRAHSVANGDAAQTAIREALRSVSLPSDDEFLARRVSQLSVGQGQRVTIAMAILHKPALLIADEATSALDTITQAETLDLFRRLNRDLGTAILYISHDLLSVAALCQRVAILNQGEIVECDSPKVIFTTPRHAYTRRLVAALPAKPSLDGSAKEAAASAPEELVADIAS
ncbi:MAG: hypothetical protein NVS9B14_15070 [Candidatus Acidiferrum sp.]